MPNISGWVEYDAARTSATQVTPIKISNVPIVLIDSNGVVIDTVLTDSSGNYQFQGVSSGNYQVSEAYGGVPGTCPPFADEQHVYVTNPPSTATGLDCTMRNTRDVTVGADNLTAEYFLNGPVRITPLVLDPSIVLDPNNLVTAASNGTFGSFLPGTTANTGAGATTPYPEIQSQFLYTEPDPSKVTPPDGSYTVQNIMNNAHSNTNPNPNPSWWRVADHTTGNETGRMMVINGYYAGNIIGETTVTVEPNTDYLTSYWILNLCRQPTGYVNPEFSVTILDQNNDVIYQHNFTNEIGVNIQCPEWIQIGTMFNTGNNTSVTIQFISEGGPETGNDFVLDDVALNRVHTPQLNITKQASCDFATAGGTIFYEVTIENPSPLQATDIILTDDLTENFEDIQYSLDDGETWEPWTGSTTLDPIDPGESATVILSGVVKADTTGTITNTAQVSTTFCTE